MRAATPLTPAPLPRNAVGEEFSKCVRTSSATVVLLCLVGVVPAFAADAPATLRGEVLDRDSGARIPCRLSIRNEQGEWFFPRSADPAGTAVEYRKQRGERGESVEMHATLSAHPFIVELPAGKYTLHAEHGKDWLPATMDVEVGEKPVSVGLALKRWVNTAERGWYSGDTHVHRTLAELPNVMLAEDLNVAFPLTNWVTRAFTPPAMGDRPATAPIPSRLIEVDRTHVFWPRNTEWEIFTVNDKSHALGAVFALNHREAFDLGAPPVAPIARRAHDEGALLELDKHNWPWSMALVPVMNVDLYELSNNHVWQTAFAFHKFGEPAPDYMRIEQTEQGFTERGWIEYGFRNYYALLNCGFRLRPTAGTASGVHPVPLGFGRVYVRLPDGFNYDAWLKGLNAGRSFVTTGPMLFVRFNDHDPGHVFTQSGDGAAVFRITGTALSQEPLERIEIVSAGDVVQTLTPRNEKRADGGYESSFDATERIDGSTWLAVRCIEPRPGNRLRFAHTAPVPIEVAAKPLRPRRVEVEFLAGRVRSQIERSRDVLPAEALNEYRQALAAYERLLDHSR